MIRWQIPFQSFDGTQYTVNIYDNSFTGTPTTLKGAGEPFVTDEDNDNDPFTPIRTQSGYISIIAESTDILNDIMPEDATDRYVTLTNASNEVLWRGFVTGEEYSQPWDRTPYALQIPVISVIGAMQNVEFTQNAGILNVYDLLHIIDGYAGDSNYNNVFVPAIFSNDDTVRLSYALNANWQIPTTSAERKMEQSENFFSCMTIYSILEEWCKFFGFTIHESGSKYIFTSPCVERYLQVSVTTTERNPAQYKALDDLSIKGASNNRDYTKAYGKMEMNFSTGANNFNLPEIGAFEESFDPYVVNDNLVNFYNNDYITSSLPTPTNILEHNNNHNGGTKSSWGSYSGSSYQEWKDYFFVRSESDATTPVAAVTIDHKTPIYTPGYTDCMLRIEGTVQRFNTLAQKIDSENPITEFYARLSVYAGSTRYYLKKTGSTYTWETTQQTFPIAVNEDGEISKAVAVTYRIDGVPTEGQMVHAMGSFKGFNAMLPRTTSFSNLPKYVKLEIFANCETTRARVVYAISGLDMSVVGCHDNLDWVYSPDENKWRFKLSKFPDTYSRDCMLTTRQGSQTGTGVLRMNNGGYKDRNAKYEAVSVNKMKTFFKTPHEVLTIEQSQRFNPHDIITDGQKRYAILSQSTNWREDTTTIKIIHYKTETES